MNVALVLIGIAIVLFFATALISGCRATFRQATDQTGEPSRLVAVAAVTTGTAIGAAAGLGILLLLASLL